MCHEMVAIILEALSLDLLQVASVKISGLYGVLHNSV